MNTPKHRPGGRPAKKPRATPDPSCNVRILNALRRMIRAADMDSRALAAKHDITAPQLICLLAIVKQESVTAVEVARLVHLSPSTLVGILDRLDEKGLIKRTRSVADRRTISLVATVAGRRVAAKTPFPLQAALDRAVGQLSAAEREEAAAWMERLVDLMSIGTVDAGPILDIVAMHQRQEAG